MLVHQSNRSCNCCGKSVDNTIIDIPFEEIKLSPFAVECDCGYFYEATHYSVSFTKWRVAKGILEWEINWLIGELKNTQEVKDELGLVCYRERSTTEKENKLAKYQADLDLILDPIPDYLWIETEN